MDQFYTASAASGLTIGNESIICQSLSGNVQGSYSTSTDNTWENIVKLETQDVQNQIAVEFNNVLHQEKEANTNALKKQKETEALKAQLKHMEDLLIAPEPATNDNKNSTYMSHKVTGDGNQGGS